MLNVLMSRNEEEEAEPMRGSKIALRMYVGLCVVVGVVVAMNVELEC